MMIKRSDGYKMKFVPFSAHKTASDPAPNNRHRLRQFREFAGVSDFDGRRVLDVGAENFISSELGIKEQTWGNLNVGLRAPGKEYEVVTCLEVINHVMNPLDLLKRIHSLLISGGTLYLSTPRLGWLAWFHGSENFSEYKPEKMRLMIEHAGFKVIKRRTYNPWPLRFAVRGYKWYPFPGLRPPLRWLFNRYQIYKCEKAGTHRSGTHRSGTHRSGTHRS